MLVATESSVGRKERMCKRRESGSVLIMSAFVGDFCRVPDRQVKLFDLLIPSLSVSSSSCRRFMLQSASDSLCAVCVRERISLWENLRVSFHKKLEICCGNGMLASLN